MDDQRRRVLRAAGVALLGGAAGCTGGGDSSNGSGGSPVDTSTTDPGTTADRTTTDPGGTSATTSTADRTTTPPPASLGTTRTVSGNPVTVTEVAVRDSLVHAPYPDELGVADADGGRYVLARVEAPEGGPDRNAFALVAGDRRYPFDLPYTQVVIEGFDRLYGDMDTDRGWLGFRVPAPLEGGPVRVETGDAAWRLPDGAVERLRRPKPTFELVEVSIPDSVDAGGTLELGLTVRNEGDRAGTFRAVFVATGAGFPCCLSHPVETEVPAGTREQVGATFGEDRSEIPREGEVDVRIKSPAGGQEGTVPVRDPTTSGGGG